MPPSPVRDGFLELQPEDLPWSERRQSGPPPHRATRRICWKAPPSIRYWGRVAAGPGPSTTPRLQLLQRRPVFRQRLVFGSRQLLIVVIPTAGGRLSRFKRANRAFSRASVQCCHAILTSLVAFPRDVVSAKLKSGSPSRARASLPAISILLLLRRIKPAAVHLVSTRLTVNKVVLVMKPSCSRLSSTRLTFG